MPAVSERQRRFMGAELGRARAGKATKTKMSESQLADYARKPMGRESAGEKRADAVGKPGDHFAKLKKGKK